MSNSDQDARSDMPRETDPSPALPTAPTSQHPAAHGLPPSAAVAKDSEPALPPRARPARRRKPAELPAADAASLFDAPDASAVEAAAPAPPRAAPRRRSPRVTPVDAGTPDGPESRPGLAGASTPDATLPGNRDATTTVPDQPTAAASPAVLPVPVEGPAPAERPVVGEDPVAAAEPEVPQVAASEPRPAEPAPKVAAPGPARPLTITASDAALAVINPHPIRANDRPDGYLYHLTSPGEAKVLLQSGLPCSFDDPIILTERGGIPYWMSVLSEDFDDILDGPAAVTVLRVRRRAVQNAVEADADSTRAAQAPCYLLTGVSGLPPVPAAPPPPQLRARPPAPAPAGDAADPGGAGVEMGGTVKWYNPRKGFGFITPGSGGKDVFVHASTLERAGLAQLSDGQTVRMQVIQGAKGPEAATLSLA